MQYGYILTLFKINLAYGSISFRNSGRKGREQLPIEFLYDPAECRLAYTEAVTQGMTAIWAAARDVVWVNKHHNLGVAVVAGAVMDKLGQVIREKIRPAYSYDHGL